ncbi:OSM3-like kinesin, putative [Bodo saltans]|uniref:OSM3-like kinesin, putative n=1 Tax=Bodo saltans TaxID=75058 RepID=A0A0S4JBA7_BODSA|nr:OSM3-like kinesin, putative [Bodo saltans]|eukprot:CUG86438.1 OSM3-like kinesin, putative [Bodo saltans]
MGKKDKADAPAESAENIKVIVRCRPLNSKEKEAGYKPCVDLDLADNTVTVNTLCGNPDRWTFDAVINNTFTQKDVFTQNIRPMVDSVLEGFNATVFAYGQSGSGKTHTMTGKMGDPELEGVIPRVLTYIFQMLKQFHGSSPNKRYSLYVSFVELYNGKVRDLLAKQQVPLAVKENKDKTFFVQGAHVPQVKTPEDILQLMEEGTERRQVASTELNSDSSRSHSVFTIVMECTETSDDGDARSVTSKLNLVDLAGSERQSKTGASGDTLKEGCNINLSLSALGTVIDTLVKGKGHVPFRSSPLTMLLKDSLGGSSKTCMFANIGPSEHNISETISTLRFADRAKQIKNKPVINMDSKDQKIAELSELVNELKEKLKQFESGGLKQLEEENEALKERVGELEVELDNAVKSREADEVDLQNLRQHADQDREETQSMIDELKKDQTRLARDVQVLETVSADERRQKDEIFKICADFLGLRSSTAAAAASGDAAGDDEQGSSIPRTRSSLNASNASLIRDVDELAKLFREFRHGGGAELSKAVSSLNTLESEHRAALKSHEGALADLQRALDEAKTESAASAKKLKKAKELLAEERDARKQIAAAAAATSGSISSPSRADEGGGVLSAHNSARGDGGHAALKEQQHHNDQQQKQLKQQISSLKEKIEELFNKQDDDPRLAEAQEALHHQHATYEARIAELQAEADAARQAATSISSSDSEKVQQLKKLIQEQDRAAIRSRTQVTELESLVEALRDNQHRMERDFTLKAAGGGHHPQEPQESSTSGGKQTATKKGNSGKKKKHSINATPSLATGAAARDDNLDDEEDYHAGRSPQDAVLTLHEVQAKLHREQRDALRDALDTTANQRNQLLLLTGVDDGSAGDDDGSVAAATTAAVVGALTQENDQLRQQFLTLSRQVDDNTTTEFLSVLHDRRTDLHQHEATTVEVEGLRIAVSDLTQRLEEARALVDEKDRLLTTTLERMANSTSFSGGGKKTKKRTTSSGGTTPAASKKQTSASAAPPSSRKRIVSVSNSDDDEDSHRFAAVALPTTDELTLTSEDESPRRVRSSHANEENDVNAGANNDNDEDDDDDDHEEEEEENPLKVLVEMLQRDKTLMQAQVSRLERELLLRTMEGPSSQDNIAYNDEDDGADGSQDDDEQQQQHQQQHAGNEAESHTISAADVDERGAPKPSSTEPTKKKRQQNRRQHQQQNNAARGPSAELLRKSGDFDGNSSAALRTSSGSYAQMIANDQQRSAAEVELRQKLSVLEIEAAQHVSDVETLRAELEEERERASQVDQSRASLLEDVKALRNELADSERKLTSVENAMHEQAAESAQIRNDASYHTLQIEDLERRVEDRSNQICELRNIVVQQKDLIHETQEESNELQRALKELQKNLADKDRVHAQHMQEREETIMKATNRRLEALADDHQRDLQRKDEDVQKIRKKLRKMEAQLQKAKEKYDEKVCEYEELSNILEEQKVDTMRLLLRAQQGGGSENEVNNVIEVQDQQEVIQSTLQRVKDEQKRKKDRFSMGENTSALSQVRAAGNAVNLVKKMGLIVAPQSTSGGGQPPLVGGKSSKHRGSTIREPSDDDDDVY